VPVMLHAFAMNPARPARLWRKMFLRHEWARGFARQRHRNRARCSACRPSHSNIGREVSPGQSISISRERGHFPPAPLRFVGSKTVRPHWRNKLAGDCGEIPTAGKATESRPCKFTADSESLRPRPCRGQNFWAIVFAVFTPAITPPLLLARPTPSRAWERDQNPRQRRSIPKSSLSRLLRSLIF